MRELRVDLPFPPRELSPNARVHWTVRYKAAKGYRRRAADEAGLARKHAGMRGRWARAELSIVAHAPNAKRLDEDNLVASLKAAFDGLADAGLVGNDRDFSLGPVVIEKGPACLFVIIRSL